MPVLVRVLLHEGIDVVEVRGACGVGFRMPLEDAEVLFRPRAAPPHLLGACLDHRE